MMLIDAHPHGSAVLQRVKETAAAIRARVGPVGGAAPVIGVVLGSGLGGFGDTLEGLVKVPYDELPHLPASGVPGHAGNFCFGRVGNVPVICMQGRVHLYEGHSIAGVVQGARTMAALGVRAVLVTNASGGLEPTWAAGDLMLVRDHINLTGTNPLIGPNDPELGPRFPDMSDAYDAELGAMLKEVALGAKIPLREGIYAGLLGPTYETPAEVRMLRLLGAHAVGMSTVHEVVALRHMGIRVGALSCITNLGAGIVSHKLTHHEVESMAKARRGDLVTLLSGWIERAGAADESASI